MKPNLAQATFSSFALAQAILSCFAIHLITLTLVNGELDMLLA
jgi:hypothetical protein